MLATVTKATSFCDYYNQWIHIYKEGAIRKVTLDKYLMTLDCKRLIRRWLG